MLLSQNFRLGHSGVNRLISGAIFVATLFIFWLSPVRGTGDTRYSMLVSQSLLAHGSFTLDRYAVPHTDALTVDGRKTSGHAYQLEVRRGHLYYYFPPGSSILSAPFVAVANLIGVSPANPDGTYSLHGEALILAALAALLMATLSAIFFLTARLVLPVGWSVLVAAGGALGTQVWSTASRVVWTDTWAILLLGAALWMLLAHETGRRALRPALLGTLMAWTYFARPTNAVAIIGITFYLLIFHRRFFIRYAAAGAFWLACFVGYSWSHFGRLLPAYFQTERLQFHNFWIALAGNLVSPSRGLLIYIPVLIFVAYLLLRYRNEMPLPRLVILSITISLAHLVAISGFDVWYGGGCYGARYTTGLVPWFVLLSSLGLRGMLDARSGSTSRLGWNAQLAAGSVLLILSVFVNARGALCFATANWNDYPVSVDKKPERVWDWRQPQFLAGLMRQLPDEWPFLDRETRIDFTSHDADKFLWYGWSGPESTHRWSEEHEAALIFATEPAGDILFRINMGGYVGHGKITEQRVLLKLTGERVGKFTLTKTETREYSLVLPKKFLRRENTLRFELPDAKSPASVENSPDERLLGVSVIWATLQP